MPQASARHILVPTEDQCSQLITEINNGGDFAALATQHSTCPSGKQSGGELGTFSPGQMVKEFDDACFNGEVGAVQGPIKTQFGYHVVQVTERN